MLAILRREYANLVTSGAQLLLLLIGLYVRTREGWLYCLSAIALISIFAWLSALKRLRAMRDTPTSKIASAAQGYVELTGRGESVGGAPLLSDLSRVPCLWCRYQIDQRVNDRDWRKIEGGETCDSFLLRDESGVCVIDPEHAEISTSHFRQWIEDDCRYSEWKLLPRDSIYVIGQFRTEDGSTQAFDSRAELNDLLAEWKKDKPRLLARFDLNQDGELDMDEWSLARQAAKRAVEKMKQEAQLLPELHFISRPVDGKPFIISNMPQSKLIRRYLLWSWLHLVIFFGLLAGIGWI